jgi:LmbE family N-acetylglucosaminyl deacetylase
MLGVYNQPCVQGNSRSLPMLSATFPRIRQVLCLGAHADDIEIGCGGTVLKMASMYPHADFHWLVFSAPGLRKDEAESSAGHFLRDARSKTIEVLSFRDGFFPYTGSEIKDVFENLKRRVDPDIIFTQYGRDLHQDHRVLSELTWNTFRDHMILEYEIPKYDGGLGSPNLFVHLTEDERRRKIELLLSEFPSQAAKKWFSGDTFDALLRLRGIESNSPSGYSEGFYCRKLCCF